MSFRVATCGHGTGCLQKGLCSIDPSNWHRLSFYPKASTVLWNGRLPNHELKSFCVIALRACVLKVQWPLTFEYTSLCKGGVIRKRNVFLKELSLCAFHLWRFVSPTYRKWALKAKYFIVFTVFADIVFISPSTTKILQLRLSIPRFDFVDETLIVKIYCLTIS
jgi:hypothetical protein